jgi:hypothetical protein
MQIAKITGQGLAAISLSVGLLWTLVVAQCATEQRASAERAHVLRDVRLLRQEHQATPVASPLAPHRRSSTNLS